MTKQRRARNRITQLRDATGNVVEDEKGLIVIATSYFRQIFESFNPEDITDALSEVSTTVTETINDDLTALVIEWDDSSFLSKIMGYRKGGFNSYG